jgi:uncharacterized protein YjiS (DUF1127 family)
MNIFKRYFNYLSTRVIHRRIVKGLNELTDSQLKDIGINRCDIDRVIWLEVDKTIRVRGSGR